PFLAGHELNIVHEQNVNRSVSLTKIENAVITNGVDHLVHEPLGRDVSQFERAIVLEHELSDGMHQMRLAKTDTAVDEERVVRARWRLGDGAAPPLRELVRRADDECVERIPWVQSCRCAAI